MDNQTVERIAELHLEAMNEVAYTLDRISERLGVIANALLQLSDNHGSKVTGPF
jgi:hypothetical protein